MLDNLFSGGLDLLAFVLPISIAATNIVFFPLAALWLLGGSSTFKRWPPVWGWPEKLFLLFLMSSLVSTAFGLDIRHSLREIKNKDFYILIAIVLVALVRDEKKCARLLKIFMGSSLLMALWGLIQYAAGVSQSDKHQGTFMHLPAAFAHWPRPLLDEMSLLNGRIMGTRGHPLAYAECLLFSVALALCFLLSCSRKDLKKWIPYLLFMGAALLGSQSRGPWIAGGFIVVLAILTAGSKRAWLVGGLAIIGLLAFASIPFLRARAVSILDMSNHSNLEREHMWQAGYVIWKSHPLLGIGPGNVKGISAAYQTADEKVWGPWGHLHSIYVNFIVERGVMGLLTFFLFMGAFVWELGKAFGRAAQHPWRRAVLQGALLGIMGFMISGFTETLYNTAVVMMTFYFVVGLALALARHEETSGF